MLVNLIMSAAIHEAFGEQSLLFAGMYVLIQVGRNLAVMIALHGHKLQRNFIRLLFWFSMTGVLWLVGGAIGGTIRNILWTVAIVLEYMSAATGFYTPVIGRSVTTDWEIHGGHLAGTLEIYFFLKKKTGRQETRRFVHVCDSGSFIYVLIFVSYFHTLGT
jgi:low temperature requirement protein LtrA